MSGTEETPTVHGEIILPSGDVPAQIADLVVQVENVSWADAPSVVISEQHQSSISLPSGAALSFAVEVPAELVDERDSYSVRVHIDVSGSGEVEVGDLVSTQSYPVLTRGHSNEARIHVQRVQHPGTYVRTLRQRHGMPTAEVSRMCAPVSPDGIYEISSS